MPRFLNHANILVVLLGFALLVPLGCGGPAKENKQPKSQGEPQKNEPKEEMANLTGPAATVHEFLEAARRGDDQRVTALLTPTARTELPKYGLSAAPKASDTARFVLGEVQMPNNEVAHVASRWIETDIETGQTHAEEATWLLRNVPEGWRVAGMARVIFPGEPPLLLNFEDPKDMIHQAEMLKAEMDRRAQGSNPQSRMARSPETAPQR